jgi:hypothetical protein
MKTIISLFIAFLALTTLSFAITTFTDGVPHTICVPTGLTYTEVANQAALIAIPIYKAPVVIAPALCADYNQYIALTTSLGLPAQATTAQIQGALTAMEGDGSNQANVNNAIKIGLEFLSLMNDIQQNGGSWSSITSC